MFRFRLAAFVTAFAGASLFVGGPAEAATVREPAQQVCQGVSLGGAEACFHTDQNLAGREFDLSIPVGQQLPVATDGNCTDLPIGFGAFGSVVNTSSATLYVMPNSCPDSHPGAVPVALVAGRYTGNILATASTSRYTTHSVRMCGPSMTLDPITLGCAYSH